MIDHVILGQTDVTVGRLGFGCEQLGGYAWGTVRTEEVIDAIAAAIDHGVTYFDTADCYGLGCSEERLGRALRPYRQRAVVGTKFGVRVGADKKVSYDNSERWLDAALEASLRRLGTDVIDLYQVHYHDRNRPLEEVFLQLERKREQGKIRYFGVTNIALPPSLEWPGLVTFSHELNLLNRSHEAAIAADISRGLTFIGYGSLAQGLLSGKYAGVEALTEDDRRRREAYVNFHGPRLTRNLVIVDKLKEIAAAYPDATPSQIALGWLRKRFDCSIMLVGIKSRQQLFDILHAFTLPISSSHLDELSRISMPLPPASHRPPSY